MNAQFQSNAQDASAVIDLTARNDADMVKVEKIVRYLCDNLGYEDVAADHEHHVTVGVSGGTIADMKKDYAAAKRATR